MGKPFGGKTAPPFGGNKAAGANNKGDAAAPAKVKVTGQKGNPFKKGSGKALAAGKRSKKAKVKKPKAKK